MSGSLGGTANHGTLGLTNMASAEAEAVGDSIVQNASVYYAVDYDGGSDGNAGWSETSLAVAGLAPLKTLEKLKEVVPPIGKKIDLIIGIKPRAGADKKYYKADGVTVDDLDIANLTGYENIIVRASSDFSDDATDKARCGGMNSITGPATDGAFAIAAGATTSSFTVSAGAITAEPGALGDRLRFVGNVTPGLAGDLAEVSIVSGGGTTCQPFEDLGAAPGDGDLVHVEKPSVEVDRIIITGIQVGNIFACIGFHAQDTGDDSIEMRSIVTGGNSGLAFCQTEGRVVVSGCNNLGFQAFWRDPDTDTDVDVGAGVTTERYFRVSTVDHFRGFRLTSRSATERSQFRTLTSFFLTGNVLNCGWDFQQCGTANPITFSEAGNNIGSNGTTQRPLRSRANIGANGSPSYLNGCKAYISAVTLEGAGANPAVHISGVDSVTYIAGPLTGSTGNTDVGIQQASDSIRSQLVFASDSAASVTGTAGNIRPAGDTGQRMSYSVLPYTNLIDNCQNLVTVANRPRFGQCIVAINDSGVALAMGDVVRVASGAAASRITSAQADTATNASGVVGVVVTEAAVGAHTYIAVDGRPLVGFDGVPTIGAIAYLSTGTIRRATTTVPAVAGTNQKLRLGRVMSTSAALAGNAGLITWHPENLAVAADGAA